MAPLTAANWRLPYLCCYQCYS